MDSEPTDPQSIVKREFERLRGEGLPPQEALVQALNILQAGTASRPADNSAGQSGGHEGEDVSMVEDETPKVVAESSNDIRMEAAPPNTDAAGSMEVQSSGPVEAQPQPSSSSTILDTETFIRMSEALKKDNAGENKKATGEADGEPTQPKKAKKSPAKDVVPIPPSTGVLTKASVEEMLERGATNADGNYYRAIVRQLGSIFSDCRKLNWCFLNNPQDIREGVNLDDAHEILQKLMERGGTTDDGEEDWAAFKHKPAVNAMHNAFKLLFANFQTYRNDNGPERAYDAHTILTIFEHPLLADPEYQKSIVSPLCLEAYHLHDLGDENGRFLKKHWEKISQDRFERILGVLQQFITCRLLDHSTNTDEVFAAVRIMKILYEINECRNFVDVSEFHNDIVNNPEILDLRQDFRRWILNLRRRDQHQQHGSAEGSSSSALRVGLSDTSLCDYPFILDPGSKAHILKLDAQTQMQSEVRSALFTSRPGLRPMPYLFLKVRRDHLIEDALQTIVGMPPEDFKKPLKIKFDGEDGIDEGGVQKEFFLLIIRQLFDPMYGMFVYDEEQRTFWFNGNCFENNLQFTLIGNLMGVAIYNSVILDVKFPRIVYEKLMNFQPTLEDLKTFNPALGKNLQFLLDLEPEKVEETFSETTFAVTVEVFGEMKEVPLKEGGHKLNVTSDNRQEYVDLYVDFILNKSIESQFNAFKKGFLDVCDGDALRLFRPHELELLICGSPTLNFEELEEGTYYEDGFDEENPTIKHFWEVVHDLNEDDKKKFLQFCTGSDRVPIRGLGNLRFVISKNGPDSELLPTSHTCFNHLLLPEYNNKEKMKAKLLIAINHSEGFGTI